MVLEEVENYTPFSYFAFEKMGPGRRHFDVVVVKAACALRPDDGRNAREDGIALSAEAAPIRMADEHFGNPEQTSLRLTGDTLLHKRGTDLFITGTARPPAGMGAHWAAEIEVKDRQRTRAQRLRFFGPRHWQWTLLKGWHLSEPTEVEGLPLRYELAFGGRHPHQGKCIAHEANPVGEGFFDPERMDRDIHYPAPQIEHFDHTTRRPGAVIPVPGLGPLPRFWAARKRYAGTYDAAWRKEFDSPAGPDYPTDFDLRFFQAAHPDWILDPPLQGGERLALRCFHGESHCVGTLPDYRLEALLVPASGQPTVAPLRLDTVEIALDDDRLYLTWRLPIPHHLEARTAVLRVLARN